MDYWGLGFRLEDFGYVFKAAWITTLNAQPEMTTRSHPVDRGFYFDLHAHIFFVSRFPTSRFTKLFKPLIVKHTAAEG